MASDALRYRPPPRQQRPQGRVQPSRKQSDELLTKIARQIASEEIKLEDVRQKRFQWGERADSLGHTRAQMAEHARKIAELRKLHEEVLARRAQLPLFEPEPEQEAPDPEAHHAEITKLRQKLVRKEEKLRYYMSQRSDPQFDARSTIAGGSSQVLEEVQGEIAQVYADLARLGWHPKINARPWNLPPEQRDAHKAPLRILSIDGGGIKGLCPAIILEHLEDLCHPHKIHELFDLICGTSTGGIIALGTCRSKVPIRAMTDIYENQAAEIWTPKHGGAAKLLPFGMDKLVTTGGSYDAKNLENILREKSEDKSQVPPTPLPLLDPAIGHHRLGGATPRVFVVSALDVEGAIWQPRLFRTYRCVAN